MLNQSRDSHQRSDIAKITDDNYRESMTISPSKFRNNENNNSDANDEDYEEELPEQDLDESISMTERLDDVKDNINKNIEQVKFRLKEVSNNCDSLNNKINEISKYVKEENNSRSAEIYNLVTEIQEIRTDRLSAFTQTQIGRFNSIARENYFINSKNSKDLIIYSDDLKSVSKSKEPKERASYTNLIPNTAKTSDLQLQTTQNIMPSESHLPEIVNKLNNSEIRSTMDIKAAKLDKYDSQKDPIRAKLSTKINKDLSNKLKVNYLRDRGRRGKHDTTRNIEPFKEAIKGKTVERT